MPTPRPRARAFIAGKRAIVSMYSPKEYQTWLAEAQRLLTTVTPPEQPFEGRLYVSVEVYVTAPKASKLPHPKPDVDNYAKGVLDAITKDGRFWSDDSQVGVLLVSKAWAPGPGSIHVSIRNL